MDNNIQSRIEIHVDWTHKYKIAWKWIHVWKIALARIHDHKNSLTRTYTIRLLKHVDIVILTIIHHSGNSFAAIAAADAARLRKLVDTNTRSLITLIYTLNHVITSTRLHKRVNMNQRIQKFVDTKTWIRNHVDTNTQYMYDYCTFLWPCTVMRRYKNASTPI